MARVRVAISNAAIPKVASRVAILFAMSLMFTDCASADAAIHIDWDRSTLTLLQANAAYPRMDRTTGGLICCYEHQQHCWVRASHDEGKTWLKPVEVAGFEFGYASNPELLVCRDNRVLLFYNERPRDKIHPFSIRMTTSPDGGATWAKDTKPIYTAGAIDHAGCYEPAALQLPSGQIQLFFANEFHHLADKDQEITLLKSPDEGVTWSEPQAVSFRKHHRDGMPVPIELLGGKGIAMAIEDNGLTTDNELKPAIIHSLPNSDWPINAVTGDSALRWAAVEAHWADHVYAGAPYLRQLSTGETLLSCQQDQANQTAQMVVYIGDGDARHFQHPSKPFPLSATARGMWNSLFVKNENTVTALSTTRIDGMAGVWAIDGHVVRENR